MKCSTNNRKSSHVSTQTYYYHVAISEIQTTIKVLARGLTQRIHSHEVHEFIAYE
jgi:hypothetical protein